MWFSYRKRHIKWLLKITYFFNAKRIFIFLRMHHQSLFISDTKLFRVCTKRIIQHIFFFFLVCNLLPDLFFYNPERKTNEKLKFSFFSHVQIFSCEISPVCCLKYPYSCFFFSHFCFLIFVVFLMLSLLLLAVIIRPFPLLNTVLELMRHRNLQGWEYPPILFWYAVNVISRM